MEAGTQFIGIKPEINMAERKSNVANNPTDVFTIEDIAAVSRPYRVYTALLTQTGGDDPQTISSGSLTQGVTYSLLEVEVFGNWDFSNVGGPTYPDNFTFVATATAEPNSWNGVLGLGYNNGAPVANVLENTIGNIWFTYDEPGNYVVNGDFTFNKTTFLISNIGEVPSDSISIRAYIDVNSVYIATFSLNLTGTSAYVDNILKDTPIEIRVYPLGPEDV